MSDLYIGLMSGTSMDGIDAALVRFGSHALDILETHQHFYSESLGERLFAATRDSGIRSFNDVADLHRDVGSCFCDAARALMDKAHIDAAAVHAIGSNGQTVRHQPDAEDPFS